MTASGLGVLSQPSPCFQNRSTFPALVKRGTALVGVLALPKASNLWWPMFFDNLSAAPAKKNDANGVDIFLYPRLWTASDDPTDPGLDYGTDWRLIVEMDGADSEGVCPWFTEGEPDTMQLRKPAAGADVLSYFNGVPSQIEGDNSACWFPKPGVNDARSVAGKRWLGLQLQVRTGALGGDAEALNALCAAVEISAIRSVKY